MQPFTNIQFNFDYIEQKDTVDNLLQNGVLVIKYTITVRGQQINTYLYVNEEKYAGDFVYNNKIYTWKSLTINQAEQAFSDCVYKAAGLMVWAL
jgi:hypothetical protein